MLRIMAAAFFVPAVLAAQTPQIDSTRVRYHDALVTLRDSLNGVIAATWAFNRDLQAAGPETVLARAAAVARRCRSAEGTIRRTEPVFRRTDQRSARSAASVLEALKGVTTSLRVSCRRGFDQPRDKVPADSVKAWGPYYARQMEEAIQRYEAAAAQFSRAVGVKVEPRT